MGYTLTAFLLGLFRGNCVTVGKVFYDLLAFLEPNRVLRKSPALWDSTHFYMNDLQKLYLWSLDKIPIF